jgi:hypothetical protein
MDFGKEAIEKIESLVKNSFVVKSGDREYSAAALKPIMYEPLPETLTVHNLRGFCGFINSDIDKRICGKPALIVVESPKEVRLISDIKGEALCRESLIIAEISKKLDDFPFKRFMTQEEFAICFRSMFVAKKGDDFDYVLSYVSKLTGGTEITGEDDGITQQVQVKRGVSGALKDTVSLKAIVRLSPYRTFREVEQPESEFLLRIRLSETEKPTIALFEADSGAWIDRATENIVAYIKSLVTGITVIA